MLVPVDLVAHGNEASGQFSLSFDPTKLSISNLSSPAVNPDVTVGSGMPSGTTLTVDASQVASGRIGVIFSSPSTFLASPPDRRALLFRFTIAASAVLGSTPIGFVDTPVTRGFADQGGNPLSVVYSDGAIVVVIGDNCLVGCEADVAPRPFGDAAVTSTDVTQVRRFATGLDSLVSGELSRADSAPRSPTFGDGVVNSADVIQARRYAAGLDPITNSNRQELRAPRFEGIFGSRYEFYDNLFGRQLRIGKPNDDRSATVSIPVELHGHGDEAGVGFTFDYDPSLLSGPRIVLDEALGEGVTLTVNDTTSGHVVVLIDSVRRFERPTLANRLVTLTFDRIADYFDSTAKTQFGRITNANASDEHGNVLVIR